MNWHMCRSRHCEIESIELTIFGTSKKVSLIVDFITVEVHITLCIALIIPEVYEYLSQLENEQN